MPIFSVHTLDFGVTDTSLKDGIIHFLHSNTLVTKVLELILLPILT